ncbi:MAG: phosphomannose isomerase type II C-terminal cupin domain, partial [Myxococcales bacterium]|nr:phosphomannose isomerase type II C-terminal cupin domain [Myxococcales bacterium]
MGHAPDLIHSLGAAEPLEIASLVAVPFVLTLDGRVTDAEAEALRGFKDRVLLVAADEGHRRAELAYAANLAPEADAAAGHRDLYEKAVADAGRSARRPWGYYKVLEDTLGHKVKRIVVYPGEALSLQLHHRRAEHWTVVAGEALVTRDEEQIRLGPGESVDIPREAKHSIECVSPTPLAFIEVQHGDYFGEDDIVR